MNAGVLHRPQRFDSARQLALEGTLIVDLLAELADAEFFLIQQFEADGAAFRQPLLRRAQAGFMHLFRRDQQRCAIFGKAVRDIHLRQLGDDGATVAVVQIAVQHAVVGTFHPQQQRDDDRDRGGSGDQQRNFRVGAQTIPDGLQAVVAAFAGGYRSTHFRSRPSMALTIPYGPLSSSLPLMNGMVSVV